MIASILASPRDVARPRPLAPSAPRGAANALRAEPDRLPASRARGQRRVRLGPRAGARWPGVAPARGPRSRALPARVRDRVCSRTSRGSVSSRTTTSSRAERLRTSLRRRAVAARRERVVCTGAPARGRACRRGGRAAPVGRVPYPGRCRERGLAPGPGRGTRLVLDPGVERFEDALLGRAVAGAGTQCGDLLLRDRLGNWTYQFAVTVDDYGRTWISVIRGADLLGSTGRQIRLARMLGRDRAAGLPAPSAATQASGEKLSKAARDTGLRDLGMRGCAAGDGSGRGRPPGRPDPQARVPSQSGRRFRRSSASHPRHGLRSASAPSSVCLTNPLSARNLSDRSRPPGPRRAHSRIRTVSHPHSPTTGPPGPGFDLTRVRPPTRFSTLVSVFQGGRMQSRWCLIVPLLLAVLAGTARAQGRTVSGTVTDSSTGANLAGVTVSVQGGLQSAQTRDNGGFVLAAVPDQDVTLVFRLIGYKRGEVRLGAGESGPVTIALNRDPFKLEEVVVTGQATGQERRNLANAVATVSSEDLDKTPTPSLEQQLQGKVAGADIQTNSGAPGGGVQVRMRGITSINAPAEPLYVVDGVIMSDVAIPSNQNAVTGASQGSNPTVNQDAQVNRIADLNPADIDRIEVLKGAAASSIYGVRASNGVVIITTKKGKAGRPQVTLSQRFGFFGLSNTIGERRFANAAEVDATYSPGTGVGQRLHRDRVSVLRPRAAAGREQAAVIRDVRQRERRRRQHQLLRLGPGEAGRRHHPEHRLRPPECPDQPRPEARLAGQVLAQHQRAAYQGEPGPHQQRQHHDQLLRGHGVHTVVRGSDPEPRRLVQEQPVRAEQPAPDGRAHEERRGRLAVHFRRECGVPAGAEREAVAQVHRQRRPRLLQSEELAVLPAGAPVRARRRPAGHRAADSQQQPEPEPLRHAGAHLHRRRVQGHDVGRHPAHASRSGHRPHDVAQSARRSIEH